MAELPQNFGEWNGCGAKWLYQVQLTVFGMRPDRRLGHEEYVKRRMTKSGVS
jgi:hypothetical protein